MDGGSQRLVHCFAEGQEAVWEAFCVDFDLAVQGSSFDDVYHKLNDQISLYKESVAALPSADQERLLNRRMPLSTTLSLLLSTVISVVGRRGSRSRHDYSFPIGPHATA